MRAGTLERPAGFAGMPHAQTIRAGDARLIFVDDQLPGITRRKLATGWAYHDPAGKRITDRDQIGRLNAIGLPPAYEDAWFCPAGNGHILATGFDARGRKQYRYHPQFRSWREGEKFDGCTRFGQLLPLVRKRVEDDLARRGISRERTIASIVRLLDTGEIRIGNKAYARDNASFGATTLRMRHAELKGQSLRLRFKAKSGKLREMRITDRSLVRFVRQMQDLPGQHLFQYLAEDGSPSPVDSADVNDYLRETMGEDFTAKFFRTWHASALAFQTLAEAREPVSAKMLLEAVSSRLGNTPAIARKSYVHPAVLGLVGGQQEWRAALRLPRATRWLSRHERALLEFLEDGPPANALLAA